MSSLSHRNIKKNGTWSFLLSLVVVVVPSVVVKAKWVFVSKRRACSWTKKLITRQMVWISFDSKIDIRHHFFYVINIVQLHYIHMLLQHKKKNNAETECNADLCKTEPDEDLIVYLDLVLLCGPILAFSYQCLQSGMSVECGNSKGSKCLVGIWLKLLILVLRYLL